MWTKPVMQWLYMADVMGSWQCVKGLNPVDFELTKREIDYSGCVWLNQVIDLQEGPGPFRGDREVLPFALRRQTATLLKNAHERGASRDGGSQSCNCKELSFCQNSEGTWKRVLSCSPIVQWYVDYGLVTPWPEDSVKLVKLCLGSSYT